MDENHFLPPTFVPGFHDEAQIRRMKYEKLGKTDMVVSRLSLGGSSFGDVYCPMTDEQTRQIIHKALKSGINYIDTAPWYGQRKSERKIGEALEGVPRKAYYIATKIGRYDLDKKTMFDFSREKTIASVQESLELLKTDYLDLIQIHDVEFCASLEQIILHTLPALLELKASGKVKSIGVNGYNIGLLKQVIKLAPAGSIDTVLSYSRMTLFNKDLAEALPFFASHGVGVVDAAPIGLGLLAEPPSWHPAPEVTKRVVRRAAEFCNQRQTSLPSLALKWSLHQPNLPTCLVSVVSEELLDENLRMAEEEITAEEEVVLREVEQKFFAFLTFSHWENLEVARYWKAMEKNGWSQNVDI